MPEKHGKINPFFPYEKEVFDDFEATLLRRSPQKLFAVLKATGLGFTEFMNRVMAWMAVSSSRFAGKRFAIIAGIQVDIAEEIVRRLVALFDKFTFLGIKRTRAKTMINNVFIDAFPAINLDSMRSYDNLAFVLVDEADFFRKTLQKSVRTVIERYIAKTNPFVYLVSTPNKPNGLFYELFREKSDQQSIYKKYEFDYTHGEDLIFTRQELKEQMGSDGFQQEYNLQFGGTIGNLFSEKSIMKNVFSVEDAQDRFRTLPHIFSYTV